jgi:trans-aconitate methyltransferase
MSDPKTIAVYNAKAAEYAAKFESDGPDAHLTAFMDALRPSAHVLDLGCGTGSATAHMMARGINATGLDASRAMLDIARTRSTAEFIEGTFDDIPKNRSFDGVWANFALLHAPRTDFPRHLTDIHAALAPKGLLHLGMKTGTGASRDGIDRHYTYYSETELKDALTRAGFTIQSTDHGEGKGLAGDIEPWIIILARRA